MPTRRSRSARTNRTPKKRTAFLKALSETASVLRACRLSRVTRSVVYEWRAQEKDFEKAWDAALELGSDALEDEAIRRAHDGVLKPVYQKGYRCGTIREYSDTLLIFMLKARRPKRFRDNIKIDANVTGGVLLLERPAASAAEWAEQCRQAGEAGK